MNEPKYDSAGFTREDDKRIKIYSGNKGKLNEIFNEYKNQKNELTANEVFDNEKMKGKSVFLFVNDDLYDQYVQDEDEEAYADENFGFAEGGYMAKGGVTKESIKRTLTSDKNAYFLEKDNDGYILYISPKGAMNSTFHDKFEVEDLGTDGTRMKYRITK
jgi:hypothetical protein